MNRYFLLCTYVLYFIDNPEHHDISTALIDLIIVVHTVFSGMKSLWSMDLLLLQDVHMGTMNTLDCPFT